MFFLFVRHYTFAQTVTKSFAGPVSGATCPVIGIQYTVSRPSGFETCSITWSITNGQKQSESGNTVIVNWNDTPGAIGTVTATFSNCGSGNEGSNNVSRSLSELILSVKNQAWGSYNNSVNIDYCTPPQVTLTVPRMFIQGTGGIAQPAQQEVIYSWNIPAGWRAVSGGTGIINISVNFISIVPINCAVPGTVQVIGIINDRCGSAGVSASATISLNGANPVLTMGPQSGYAGAGLCNTTPVTFYATPNVALGCINSYSWTYPTSWSFSSQSGNSITLQPSGSSSDSGPIRATANMSCGTSISSGTYTPPYTSPSLTGPDLVCSTGTFSVQNASGVSFTWSSSNTSIATINSSGVVSRVGSANGYLTVTATPPCSVPALTKTVWIGTPLAPGAINGAASPSVGGTYVYNSLSDAPGATSYTWTAPTAGSPSWIVYGPTNTLAVAMKVGAAYGYVKAIGINACGNGTPSAKYITPVGSGGGGGGGGGGGTQPRISSPSEGITKSQIIAQLNEPEDYIVGIPNPYPNPATDEIIVEYTHAKSEELVKNFMKKNGLDLYNPPYLEEAIAYSLISLSGKKVIEARSSNTEFRMDVRNVPNGTYILGIQYGNLAVEKHKILIVK